ncbi:MAG: Gfo/Idh/MocA family oxidoreductase [Bacteroidales bacterium]|nr:Gfo/Idh/MocA family oxidoreductase [Bacteroidales bacterium]
MFQDIISRYKRRNAATLMDCPYPKPVAIVGLGTHCITNIVPVLEQLRVPISHILVRSPHIASVVARRFPDANLVDSIPPVLDDPSVKTVFVATPATTHLALVSQLLQSSKNVFIEKPPCETLAELHQLILLRKNAIVQVGLQKRFAPAVRVLQRQLGRHRADHYLLRYGTGAYPEGDALTDLFIHPLDLAVHLFGPAEVVSIVRSPDNTILLHLDHNGTKGALELSTSYSWQQPVEELTVVTKDGVYSLESTDCLSFSPRPHSFIGIPLEKIHPRHPTNVTLYHRDTFSPVFSANRLVSSGFYYEIEAFLSALQHNSPKGLTTLESLIPVYKIMESISRGK